MLEVKYTIDEPPSHIISIVEPYLDYKFKEDSIGYYYQQLNKIDTIWCFYYAVGDMVELIRRARSFGDAVDQFTWSHTDYPLYFNQLKRQLDRGEYQFKPKYIEEDGPYEG